jgi:hypothetical protein
VGIGGGMLDSPPQSRYRQLNSARIQPRPEPD